MVGLDPIPARPVRLTETVYARIREAIVSSRIAPGAQVTEAGLAEQLAVSKTPVREALVRLAYVGFVVPEGRRGLRVITPSLASIRAAYEVRTALEVQTARLAAERGGDDDIHGIENLAGVSLDAAKDGDLAGFRSFDRQFHLAIAAAAGNQRLADLLADYLDLTSTLRYRDVPNADESRECAVQHRLIAESIIARSPNEAETRIREHISKVQTLTEAEFRRRESTPDTPATATGR